MPDEHELFVALHTCAYRVRRPGGKRGIPEEERAEWARRWEQIREYIVEKNLGLVYSMIRRFDTGNQDEDDLLSEAMLGLTRAVDRFNPWKGYRFSTYACNVISRALMRRSKRENTYRRLFPVRCDVSSDWPDRFGDPARELYVERLHRVLDRNLGNLTDLEMRILQQRFPGDHLSRPTFREIGKAVGLSKERIRQIQNTALGKLRHVLEADPVLRDS